MRIISLNCNGIRSAHQKGLFQWLSRQRADVLCLQEIKAQTEQLTDAIKQRTGWHSYFMPAEKPGYSGVAVYSRHIPDNVVYGFGNETYDYEGRYLQLDFGKLSIASLYLPSGSSSEARQAVKFEFLDFYLPRLQQQRNDGREYILCGDWNIAHKEIDLKNWRANQKNSGFLPEERAFMETVFTDVGYVDAFRRVNDEAGQYTWWSNRGQAWANNVGWRIDYQVITPALAERVSGASIYKRKRFSDHAPLLIDYAGELPEIGAA
jgi:exodeoxyribonuclease-3